MKIRIYRVPRMFDATTATLRRSKASFRLEPVLQSPLGRDCRMRAEFSHKPFLPPARTHGGIEGVINAGSSTLFSSRVAACEIAAPPPSSRLVRTSAAPRSGDELRARMHCLLRGSPSAADDKLTSRTSAVRRLPIPRDALARAPRPAAKPRNQPRSQCLSPHAWSAACRRARSTPLFLRDMLAQPSASLTHEQLWPSFHFPTTTAGVGLRRVVPWLRTHRPGWSMRSTHLEAVENSAFLAPGRQHRLLHEARQGSFLRSYVK